MHFAYIDGGTGSMALQMIIAGGLSLVYAISTKWALIKKKFSKKNSVPGTIVSK